MRKCVCVCVCVVGDDKDSDVGGRATEAAGDH